LDLLQARDGGQLRKKLEEARAFYNYAGEAYSRQHT
jgi:hypothetical protein